MKNKLFTMVISIVCIILFYSILHQYNIDFEMIHGEK